MSSDYIFRLVIGLKFPELTVNSHKQLSDMGTFCMDRCIMECLNMIINLHSFPRIFEIYADSVRRHMDVSDGKYFFIRF